MSETEQHEAPQTDYRKLIHDGIWTNNAGLVQLLGLCPLLAVTTTTINGLGLGLATTLTLIISNLMVSSIRNVVTSEIRIPVFVLIIACTVTGIELAMNAWFHELFLVLGIFIPLIVTNCAIIGRAEAFASRNSFLSSLVDAISMGVGFTLLLMLLGVMRELFGFGTLFAQSELMFGDGASWMTMTLVEEYRGFLLAILPPGAFIGLGLIIAAKNRIDQRMAEAQTARNALEPQPV